MVTVVVLEARAVKILWGQDHKGKSEILMMSVP